MIEELKLTERDFKTVQKLIFDLAGISLSNSKQVMVHGRLAKRVRHLNLSSYSEYINIIVGGKDPDETTKFINSLTTNKTDFFREKHHFDFLTSTVFPSLRDKANAGRPKKLRIWCSASSTGEEPYTIAISVREFFGANTDWDIRILASDIDTDVLSKASAGVYDAERLCDVPLNIRHNYFTRESRSEDARWTVKPVLRDLITFRQINLQQTPWQINTKFDIIFCRNVMIYFNAETQSALIERFAEKLDPEGHLIIGHSESLFGITNRFKPLGETIYGFAPGQAIARTTSTSTPNVGTASSTARNAGSETKVTSARPRVVDKPAPASVIESNSLSGDRKHSIIVGEVHASREPVWISTVLGSCVATCLYDEATGIGGMNHFMLPESKCSPNACASFGVHAMEMLINEIMRCGGDRRRLKAKFFGGGAVVHSQSKNWNIGDQNIEFTRNFLETEGIPIVAAHTGGTTGMRVQFHTQSAKVLVKPLDPQSSLAVEQMAQKQSLRAIPRAEVVLF